MSSENNTSINVCLLINVKEGGLLGLGVRGVSLIFVHFCFFNMLGLYVIDRYAKRHCSAFTIFWACSHSFHLLAYDNATVPSDFLAWLTSLHFSTWWFTSCRTIAMVVLSSSPMRVDTWNVSSFLVFDISTARSDSIPFELPPQLALCSKCRWFFAATNSAVHHSGTHCNHLARFLSN